jgi:hypothetical protein
VRWLAAAIAVSPVVVLIVCLTGAWRAPQELGPLLAVPPALAGIGAATAKRPLAYGAVGIVAAAIAGVAHDALAVAALIAAAVVTALSAVATVVATAQHPNDGERDLGRRDRAAGCAAPPYARGR